MKLHASSRSAAGNDLRLTLRRRMLDPHIQTAPPDRIAQPPLLIAGEHHKRNALGLNRPKLRNRELPRRQNLQQQSLKSFIHLVEFVDQQHTRLLAFERPHQRTRPKEIASLEVGLQLAPAPALSVPLRELHVKPLKALVEAPDGLVLSDPAVALQPLDMRPGRLRNRDRELRLAAPRRPFKQQRLLQLRGQKTTWSITGSMKYPVALSRSISSSNDSNIALFLSNGIDLELDRGAIRARIQRGIAEKQ